MPFLDFRFFKVLEGRRQYVEIAGNMATVAKTNEHNLYVNFRPFRENRLQLIVRLRDLKSEPAGQVLFVPEPPRGPAAGDAQKPPAPVCVLNVVLPNVSDQPDAQTPDLEIKDIQLSEAFPPAAGGGGKWHLSLLVERCNAVETKRNALNNTQACDCSVRLRTILERAFYK